MKCFHQNFICGFALALFNLIGSQAQGDTIWAVTNNNALISWNSSNPATVNSSTAITGLQSGEQLVGIDVRTATGAIFAIGSSNRLYTVNMMTGAATQVGAPFSIPLAGTQFAYDFNPTIDRSRLVSNLQDNYVVNPNDGVIGQFTDVFYAAGDPNVGMTPSIVHAAYNNNVNGATTSQLFSIDSSLNVLARQANSAGTLNTVGGLGVDINGIGGFDISSTTGIAYAAMMLEGSSMSQFFTINLTTGQATSLGQIGSGGGNMITAMTIAIPEPATGMMSIAGLGMLAARRYRRREA